MALLHEAPAVSLHTERAQHRDALPCARHNVEDVYRVLKPRQRVVGGKALHFNNSKVKDTQLVSRL